MHMIDKDKDMTGMLDWMQVGNSPKDTTAHMIY